MKRLMFLSAFLLLNIPFCSPQEIVNNPVVESLEAIRQISTDGLVKMLSIQSINQGLGDIALCQQAGNQNIFTFHQQGGDPLSGTINQSYNFQQGNFNELLVSQFGNGNLLLSFQLGYLANELGANQSNQPVFSLGNSNGDIAALVTQNKNNGIWVDGERNKIEISQEGTNNGIMTVQQGDDNSISAVQKGKNNFLLILQEGKNNSVNGYTQENISDNPLYDTIIQQGDNLSLSTDGVSRTSANQNIYSQTGTNLSLEVNNGFVNSTGGIEVTQTGKDMKVVVDQSYFPMPLK
jgi:hypothetical protein